MIRFYNTLSGKIEPLRPRRAKRVNMFVCGPTVYDLSHIGHARTYIVFDMIARYLRMAGYKMFYLQNITDIDDKIIDRAHKEKRGPLKLSKEFEKEYYRDMKTLHIQSVNAYARATDFIPQIIKQIQRLLKRKYAYVAKDKSPTSSRLRGASVYFDIVRFPSYGKLSRQNLKKLRKAVRVELDPNKKHDFDFVLWKTSKPGEPAWKSPWGLGRPGWHIEDTAISEHYFGPQYDVHGGGRDLIFPHHESEIAQQEAASGKKPFVKYWLHTGFLTLGGQKMAKSLGNVFSIRDFLDRYSFEVLRFLMLLSHYRSPLAYTDTAARQAKESLQRIVDFVARTKTLIKEGRRRWGSKKRKTYYPFDTFEKNFVAATESDFNTPKAFALLFNFIHKANRRFDADALDPFEAQKILAFFKQWNAIFEILPKKEMVPYEIQELARKREVLRREYKWEEADLIRTKIQSLGWIVEDTPKGPKFKRLYT